MAFIPEIARATGLSAEHTFYLLRILLGFAEAGFFPGIIFFLTLWFPASYRARIVGYFMAAVPLSSALGSPVSAALLGLDGVWDLRGWQWLFIVEALPSIVLGRRHLLLSDRPSGRRDLARRRRRAPGCSGASRSRTRGASMSRRRSALASLADIARAGAVARLFRRGRLPLRRRLLAADDRQGLRPFDPDDRLGQRDPLCRRLCRHGVVGHALGPDGRTDDASGDPAGAGGDRRSALRRSWPIRRGR